MNWHLHLWSYFFVRTVVESNRLLKADWNGMDTVHIAYLIY